ncbi:HET-domain-containing protein, partial [Dendrothele bispora CBS 962.96]
MRLLNVRSLALEEFHGNPPPYAILSHTWEAGEVLFQDLQPSAHRNLTEKKLGYQKIRMSCNLAREDDIPYIWIDTCCINKESSAELSEAINSMFRYYRNSIVCYAHLFDVRRGSTSSLNFYKCKWFTRGWTLQELLAPSNVIFLDMDWVELGTKHSLQDFIAAGTGIPTRALVDFDGESFSVAQMMSWASQRRTTREEDQAYCLMGIFGVHMPALYGEGAVNAFTRLQLEIIKRSYDQSIFVWSMPVGSSEPRGLLARSPSEFRASGKIRVADGDTGNSVASTANEKTFSMTNNGLRINLPL